MTDNPARLSTQVSPNWRKALEIHPAALLLPRPGRDQLQALGRNIKQVGMQLPVVVLRETNSETGKIKDRLLDGISRFDAMVHVGIAFTITSVTRGDSLQTSVEAPGVAIPPVIVIVPDANFDPIAYVMSVNVARRYLPAAAKRDLIVKILAERPQWTSRAIAVHCCCSHTTVGAVRKELKRNGRSGHCEDRVEADGKRARGRKPGEQQLDRVSAKADFGACEVAPEATPATKPTDAQDTKIKFDTDRKIATLARAILELLKHPTSPNVETAREKAARIVRLVDPASAMKPVSATVDSNVQLDRSAFSKALRLDPADLEIPDFLKREPATVQH